VNQDLEQIWTQIKAELRAAVDETTYRVWLEPLKPVEMTDGTLSLVASGKALGWISDRFGRLLQTCAAVVLGPEIVVSLVCGEDERGNSRHNEVQRSSKIGSEQYPQPLTGPSKPHVTPLGLNPKLTFDQFVIGDSNRLAHAAALSVAEMPGQAYNPLFICGPPGVGKTHLLHSIGALLLTHNPGLTVRCTTGEAFTNEFIGAVSTGHMETFKSTFRRCDVLLVDDVQFLERKAKTEEEFFHTFNALHEAGSQIVLSSDKPPEDLQALEDRLRERFQAGLVADIAPPDLSTRMTVLRKRVHYDRIELCDHGVLPLLAQRIVRNIRALEGALIRVVAFSSLTGRPITTELTEEVLHGLYPDSRTASAPATIAEIQTATCEQFGLSHEDLLSSTRTARISWPRQVAMYLARELTDESLPVIGRHFGGRDHSTVLHAWKRADERIEKDQASRAAVDKLRTTLSDTHHDRTS
jgi:chromosomal replication initiator protein